jgi:flagellar basal body-associated protein FliL
MSDAAAAGDGKPAKEAAPKKPISIGLILVLVNTLTILGALGTFVYTRILFKRPPITEEAERERLAKEAEKARAAAAVPGTLAFEPVTVNIKPSLSGLEPAGAQGLGQGKLHYATVTMTFELRDIRRKELLEELKPVLLDKFFSLMGRKSYGELTSVQGRYVLRTQLIDLANQLLAAETKDTNAVVTNIFFTTFMVQ